MVHGRHDARAGRRHLDRLARCLLDGTDVVYLEPADNPKLDQSRHLYLVNVLLRYGIKDAERRVVIAYPLGEGLYAEDALVAYPRLFINRGFGGGFGGLGGY